VVVGLGGMGSAAAYHLAVRGRRVLGLERFTPAHAQGSSHGGSRVIRLAYFEGPEYVPLLLRAYELWRALEEAAGLELLLQTGGWLLGPPGSELVTRTQSTAEQFDLAHEVLDGPAIRQRVPTLAAGDDTVALFDPAAGVVRPEATVAAHLRLAEAAGAELRFEAAVTGWETAPDTGGVVVRASGEAFAARHLVVCPGVWAPALLPALEIPLSVERQVNTWFQPPGGLGPFHPDRHPVWVWDPGSGRGPDAFPGFVYGVPALDGPDGGMKINVIREDRCTPETIDRTVSDPELEAISAGVRRCLSVDPGPVVRADTCMFENTPDNHFVVGPHPGLPQVVVAAGFSGHGFKFVPVIGEILADLVCDGKSGHALTLFGPGRFATGGSGARPLGG
jgi:sarcosine oxidase